MTEWVTVTYRVKSRWPLAKVAEMLAREQSSFGYSGFGSLKKAAAEIVETRPVERTDRRARRQNKWGDVVLRFPSAFAISRPSQLLNATSGEVHHIAGLDAVWVDDISGITKLWNPPQRLNGVGTRHAVWERPDGFILCGAMKPPVGLSPAEYARLADAAWRGGADIVKDDELNWIEDDAFAEAYLAKMLAARNSVQQRCGARRGFVANLICGGDKALRRLRQYQKCGVDGVLVAPGVAGFDTLRDVRERFDGLVMAHNSLVSAMCAGGRVGISPRVFAKIAVAAGADVVITPSPWGTFRAQKRLTRLVIDACRNAPGRHVWPALAGGKSVGNLQDTANLAGGGDFWLIVGGALFLHPQGPEAGARAFGQAWELIQAGQHLRESRKPELRAAVRWATDRGLVGPSWRQGARM